MNPPTVLHIDIDAFFAAVEIKLNPRLKGKPVIVGGNPDERGVVCTASYEARKFGVHSGMALRTAAAKCPQGIFLRGRYHLYERISQLFFRCLGRFSPRVEEVSVDEAYLDLSGCRFLSSSIYRRAQEIKEAVESEIGLSVSLGLGVTKLGAKLATDMAKPGGIFYLFNEKEFLAEMAVEHIPGIGPHTALILQGLGIHRVKQLHQVYPVLWKKILGPHLFSQSRFSATGRAQAKSFSRETTFPQDIADRQMLLAHLSYLIDRLSVYLNQKQWYAGRLEIKVRFSDFSTFCQRIRLDFPTFAYPALWQRGMWLLNRLLAQKKRPLRLIGAKVDELVKQRGLLSFVCLRGEQLSSGIRQVKERFGFSAIYTGREMLLEQLYPVERDGMVLKTASLTK